MVTVFNPQALGDPGPTAAAGLIGAGLSSAAGLIGNRTRSKAEILASLIGQAGAGLRESFTRANENEQGRQALDFAIQSGQLPGLQGTKVPDNLKIDPSSVNALLGQASYARLLGTLGKQTDIGEAGSKAGIPGSGDILADAIAKAGGLTGAIKPPISQSQPQSPELEKIPTQLENGSYALGATNQPSSSTIPKSENLIEKQARMATQQKELELRDLQIKARPSDPNYLYGYGNTNIQDLRNQRQQGMQQKAIDLSGAELNEPMSMKLAAVRNTYASYPDAKRAEIAEKSTIAPGNLSDYFAMAKRVIDLRNSGTIDRTRLRLIASGLTDQLGQLQPDEEEVLTFLSQTAPMVIQAAGADQSANSISNRDIEPFKKAIGDPTASSAIFIKAVAKFGAKGYLNALRNAASTNADNYNELKQQIEQLTGQPFDFEKDANNIDGVAQLIEKKLIQDKQGKAMQSAQQGLQSQRPVSTQSTSRPVSGGSKKANMLQEIDLILQQQGAL